MKNGLHSVIYLLYNSKLISVLHIGYRYINVQIIGIGYKKINIGRSLIVRSSACFTGINEGGKYESRLFMHMTKSRGDRSPP